MNCASVRWAMRIQGVFTAAKLLALVAIVIAGVVHISGGQNTLPYNKYGEGKFPFPVALRPNAGHGLHIHEVSRSHTATHHSR